MRLATLVAIVTLLMACASISSSTRATFFGTRGSDSDVIPASLYYLVANPSRMNRSKVRTSGVLNLVYEGYELYVDRESYDHMLTLNSLWLEIDLEQLGMEQDRAHLIGETVELEGTFIGADPAAPCHGRTSRCVFVGTHRAGKLVDISYVRVLDSY